MNISDWLPPEFQEPGWAALILLVSFLGSATTAALSIGGGLLLIAAMSAVMPPVAVVPVHGVVMLGSNAGRFILLRDGVDWRRVGWFSMGAIVGAFIGAQVVLALPPWALRMAIGSFILFTQWGPKISMPTGNRSFAVAGSLSTFLTLFVGASGPFVSAILAKVPTFNRIQLVATAGACMSIQHGMKVAVFAVAGFAYWQWMPFIIAAIATGFAGTVLGAKFVRRVDEATFRTALKWLLTALALYLLIMAAVAGIKTN